MRFFQFWFLCIIHILIFENKCVSQSSWIKTLNLDYTNITYTNDSSTVGPIALCLTTNNSILTLMQVGKGHATRLFCLDTMGNILWNISAGYYGTLFEENCSDLHPTIDNGCVYKMNRHDFGISYSDFVYRLDSSGNVIWTKTYIAPYGVSNNSVLFIKPTFQNTFYLSLSNDTLYELDGVGNLLRTSGSLQGGIFPLPDSSFIRVSGSTFSRQYFNGTQLWSNNLPGFTLSDVDSSIIYAASSDSLMKINTANGNTIWKQAIRVGELCQNSAKEIITLDSSQITKYDSSGSMLWTKYFSFPYFDFHTIISLPDNNIVTGGCWKNINLTTPTTPGFSPFLTRIDQNGAGIIDSTDFYYVGNANDDNSINFGEEAVYIAAALNSTGQPRDALVQNMFPLPMSIYGTNWTDRFGTGLNYKFSDVDGNGTININDIISLQQTYPYSKDATPHWNRQASPLLFPELVLKIENDTLTQSDTIKVHVILGSASLQIDSIYGISFSMAFDTYPVYHPFDSAYYLLHPSNLGDSSTNLFVYHNYNSQTQFTSMVLCRNDHVNTILSGDTIVTIYYLLSSNITSSFNASVGISWSAITEAGFPVSLNLIGDTTFITTTTRVNSYSTPFAKIFPQPAHEFASIIFNKIINEFSIYDFSGKLIEIKNTGQKECILNVKNYPNGIYIIKAESDNSFLTSKFIIQH